MGLSVAKSPLVQNVLKDNHSLAVNDGDYVHFLVTQLKGKNYVKHCNNVVFPQDSINTIRMYTEHNSELYSEVNLALASDAEGQLKKHGGYIEALRASILERPMLDDGIFYRGIEMSNIEIAEMEKLGRFFIPSFTSTSVDAAKAYEKNTLINVKVPYMTKYACSITPDLSNYYNSEKEVLFACYSAFQLERVEKVASKSVVTLFLDEYASAADYV